MWTEVLADARTQFQRRRVTTAAGRCWWTRMAATSADPLARLEAAARAPGPRPPSRRMLIIVNPYATTVSDRLKNLVVYALRGTLRGRGDRHRGPRPRHRAVPRGRRRGLRRRRRVRRRRHRQRGRQRPGRLRDAADLPARRPDQRLLPDARHPHRRRRRHRAPAADRRRLAPAAGRPRRRSTTATSCSPPASDSTPAWSSGSTPTRDSRPAWASGTTRGRGSRRSTAATCCTRRGSRRRSAARRIPGVTAIVQNATPYTYFGDRPVDMGEGATLDSGDLAGVVLERASPLDIPTIIWRALSKRARVSAPPPRPSVQRRRGAVGAARSTSARCRCRSTATTSARSRRRGSRVVPGGIVVVS